MRKITLAALLCASAIGVAAPPALAQPMGPPPPGGAVPGHDFRDQIEALENRVRDGVRDNQIDRGEFDRAMRDIQEIRDQERDLRDRHGGRLTDMDRGALQQHIDQVTRSIHWMRENGPGPRPGGPLPPPPGALPPPPPGPGQWSLDRREDWIQQRIERGRADGSLDRREAYRAQRSLNDIRATQARLIRRDRGRLTDADRLYIEQRLDRLNQNLHWMRDNGERAPWWAR